MTTHPAGTLARITWARPGQPPTTSNAVRATVYSTGALVWATDRATIDDSIVTGVVPLIPVDLTNLPSLSAIVDDANRNGAGLTVHDLAYALREHRRRATGETASEIARPAQRSASNSEGRKRATEAGGDR